jgi:transposase-like protein
VKGKTYPDEIKEQVLKEVEETGNVALVARNHGIPSTTINTWISKKNLSSVKSSRGPISSNFNSNNYTKEIEKENDKLKKLLGEKDLEIAILNDL